MIDTVVAFSALGVFVAIRAHGEAGLKSAILFYSVIDMIAGTLTWFLLQGRHPQAAAKAKNGCVEPA